MRRTSVPGFAALAVMGVFWTAPAVAEAEKPLNVILVVLDTARQDHFSTYGYARETTPSFTRFADEGIRFDRAYSTSCWTIPSHASLFTGQYPLQHGANQETQYLDDDSQTLAEILNRNGYATAAVSGNPWVSPKANLTQGFEDEWVIWTGAQTVEGSGLPHRSNGKVFRWLDQRMDSRPFFVFINYIEPHWKYNAPEDLQRRFVPGGQPIRQDDPAMFPWNPWYLRPESIDVDRLPVRTGMYDADLAYADRILGELLDGLESRGLMDSCLVVVTSDHGENHGDAGHLGHIFALTEATIRVPLAVRLPEARDAGTVRTDPVQLTDLFSTILAAVDVAPPEDGPGRNLFDGPGPPDRPMLAEYYYPRQVLASVSEKRRDDERLQPFRRRIRSLTVGTTKWVWGSDGRHALYDLALDPAEERNRLQEDPRRAQELQEQLDRLMGRYGTPLTGESPASVDPRAPTLDPETEEQLRALGYVE